MKPDAKFYDDRNKRLVALIDTIDPEDKVFTDAAMQMVADSRASKSRRPVKMIVSEIIYKGQRHEIWLSKQEIFSLSYRKKKPLKQLAGCIKKKLLNI